VLSHALARRWDREAAWGRYATAFNWCQWTLPILLAGLLLGVGLVVSAGPQDGRAGAMVVLALSAYALWLHWFVARWGLGLSRGRAAGFVALVSLGTGLLSLPRFVHWLLGDGAPPG
jgi:hypothetical protein